MSIAKVAPVVRLSSSGPTDPLLNGYPRCGRIYGENVYLIPWAASVRPLCGRFGQAKSVHCAGRPCRRHTQ